NARRNRIHQDGARVARQSARHIDADSVDCRPAPAKFDAGIIAIAQIGWKLAGVMRLDALAGDLQRFQRRPVDDLIDGCSLFSGDAQAVFRWIQAVEPARVVEVGSVTFYTYARDHFRHNGTNL